MKQLRSRIFLVDDDDGVRKALSRLLRANGFEVDDFNSAESFLQSGVDGPGCMILDVQMPGLDGLSLQDKMKQNGIRMPVIFITAHGDVPMSVKAMKRGAVDFLQKPFEEEDLLRAITVAMRRDRERRERCKERIGIKNRIDSLTRRERQVFERVIAGALNKQIAADLGVSEKTVKAHRARVMKKMEALSLAQLVRMGERVDL